MQCIIIKVDQNTDSTPRAHIHLALFVITLLRENLDGLSGKTEYSLSGMYYSLLKLIHVINLKSQLDLKLNISIRNSDVCMIPCLNSKAYTALLSPSSTV